MEQPLPEASLGQGNAFTEYALPELEALLRVAMSLTAEPADAEDLVQDNPAAAVQVGLPVRRPASACLAAHDHAAPGPAPERGVT